MLSLASCSASPVSQGAIRTWSLKLGAQGGLRGWEARGWQGDCPPRVHLWLAEPCGSSCLAPILQQAREPRCCNPTTSLPQVIAAFSLLTLCMTCATSPAGPILASDTLQCQETSATLGTSPEQLSASPANSSPAVSDTQDSSSLIGAGPRGRARTGSSAGSTSIVLPSCSVQSKSIKFSNR